MDQPDVEGINNSKEESAPADTGCLCLCMLARFHQVAADPQALQHEFGHSGQAFSDTDILRAAKYLKLKAKNVKTDVNRLKDFVLPAIAKSIGGEYFILANVNVEQGKVLIQKPGAQRPETLTLNELEQHWSGAFIGYQTLLVTRHDRQV
jgi:ATP-binding cassette, subfamily B, bacterial HlyB/CyaB